MNSIEKAAERLSKQQQNQPERSRESVPEGEKNSIEAAAEHIGNRVKKDTAKRAHAADIHIEKRLQDGKIGLITGILAEQYRMLKRRVRFNLENERIDPNARNMVMVTSALPGEGKTFNALNLAISLSKEMDHTVLLVDTDLVKRSLSNLLGLKDSPGLVDVLSGRSSMPEVLKWSDIPKLAVLPAGCYEPQAVELLSSDKMRDLATEIATRYSNRIVLFDAPPLLSTSHAAVLSSLMGQVLFVVAQGTTPQQAVKEGVDLLSPNPLAGFVFNMASGTFDSYYGRYYVPDEQQP
ncbi:AAA family ATPase [Thiohalomonas denitrificans]|uniref:AAA family ATPase n=1 Tax=Thiohalomonas denitrificans TaxID=415747 RepID=UPI0026EC33B9|nr:AAA family ATPase [Thiohalomonas denitrificans]